MLRGKDGGRERGKRKRGESVCVCVRERDKRECEWGGRERE